MIGKYYSHPISRRDKITRQQFSTTFWYIDKLTFFFSVSVLYILKKFSLPLKCILELLTLCKFWDSKDRIFQKTFFQMATLAISLNNSEVHNTVLHWDWVFRTTNAELFVCTRCSFYKHGQVTKLFFKWPRSLASVWAHLKIIFLTFRFLKRG